MFVILILAVLFALYRICFHTSKADRRGKVTHTPVRFTSVGGHRDMFRNVK